jgi:hypothetical protein
MFKNTIKSLIAVASIFVAFTVSTFAQTTNEEKLSYLLLRGNYPVTNGYAPNGVHAGIDFGNTGDGVTSVYAPVSGTVTANTGTCGKVAIFDGVNTIIMAHMTARTALAVGSQITGGDYVGKASQVVGGGCSVTGPHLHIEIRTGNNTTMALPSNNNTSTTLNPLTYFTYNAWEFNTNNNFQGWTIYNISAASVNGGSLFMDPWDTPNDPYLFSPYIALTASGYPYFKTRLASNALDGNGMVYFKTAAENFYSEDKKVSFTVYNCYLCGNAAFNSYSVYMGGNAKWSGVITGVRLDPAQQGQGGTNADSIGIDYIRLSMTP